jgi:hypothetical protein
MRRSLVLVLCLGLGTSSVLGAQSSISPRPSQLFGARVPGHGDGWAVADTVQDKRIAAAIGFGVVGALLGGLIAGGGDDGFLPSTPTIIVFGVVGAVAGYITGGRSTE